VIAISWSFGRPQQLGTGKSQRVLAYMARPERFERPTPRFVVYGSTLILNANSANRVWLRYELFRGRLTDVAHQASEVNLLDFIKRHENTKQHLSCMTGSLPP
jgi:hypothetical protein